MSGISEDERLKLEEERMARTMAGGSHKRVMSPHKPAEVHTPAAPSPKAKPVVHAASVPKTEEQLAAERHREEERRQTEELERRNRERREAEQKQWGALADERDVFYAGKLNDTTVAEHNAEIMRRNKEREAAAQKEEEEARQKKQAQEEMRARMQRMAAAANQYAPK